MRTIVTLDPADVREPATTVQVDAESIQIESSHPTLQEAVGDAKALLKGASLSLRHHTAVNMEDTATPEPTAANIIDAAADGEAVGMPKLVIDSTMAEGTIHGGPSLLVGSRQSLLDWIMENGAPWFGGRALMDFEASAYIDAHAKVAKEKEVARADV